MSVGAHVFGAVRAAPSTKVVTRLYRVHFGYVWQVLRKLGVRRDQVEDAVHDVFVVVHRRYADFEGRSAARTWLFGIARRIASRYRRSAQRRRRRHTELRRALSPEPPGPDAFVARQEAWQALLDFLDGLDEPQREAFVLGEIEGATRAQMGRLLGISPNTAYSRLLSARRRFATAFPKAKQREAVAAASIPASAKARGRVLAALLVSTDLARPVGVLTSAKALALGGALGLAGVLAAALPAAVGGRIEESGPSATVRSGAEGPATEPAAAAIGTEVDRRPSQLAPVDGHTAVQSPALSVERPRAPREVSGDMRPATGENPPSNTGEKAPRRVGKKPRPGVGKRVPSGRPVVARNVQSTPVAQAANTGAAADPPVDISPAMAHLADARSSLRRGDAKRAFTLLARSRALDPRGAFATERAVTRIWALCVADRTDEARREVRRLRRSDPGRAYGQVLSTSCVADMIGTSQSGDQGPVQ